LYGCETWSLDTKGRTQIENRVLRRIFGRRREVGAGGWRRLNNEELHNLDTSPDIVRVNKARIRWVARVARTGEMRNSYKTVVGRTERRDN
jgi:hypothetical protein